MSNPVAVVTINWNGADNSLRCLAALRASQGADWHLYIVDNASTDGSPERIAAALATDGATDGAADATLIRSPVNGGWTGGNNLGIERALAEGHDLVFVLNNDAFVRSDTLAVLLAAFDRERLPVLGPVQRAIGPSSHDFVVAHHDAKTGVPTRTPVQHRTAEVEQPTYPTALVNGAGMLIHRHHIEAIGLFDERFYLNYDDNDWSARACKAGFPLLMVRDAVIDHLVSASIGGSQSPLQTYFMTRNRLLYAEKHRPIADRLRLIRRQIWRARELVHGPAWRMLAPQRDPVAFAFRRGVIDYCARRFGDCPDSIRAAQAAMRAAPLPAPHPDRAD